MLLLFSFLSYPLSTISHKNRYEDGDSEDLDINEALAAMKAFSGKKKRVKKVTLKDAPEWCLGRKRIVGGCWLTNGMRYRTLWEHEGPETVVVCDVHDKSNVQDERLDELIRKTSALGKQMGITFWHAEGHQDDCLNGSALPLKGHCHTDGGLAIWHWGSARETARQIGPYEDYCASVLQGVSEIPRGIDEMLFDSFTGRAGVAKKNAHFSLHVHCIRPGAPSAQTTSDSSTSNEKQRKGQDFPQDDEMLHCDVIVLDLGTKNNLRPRHAFVCPEIQHKGIVQHST